GLALPKPGDPEVKPKPPTTPPATTPTPATLPKPNELKPSQPEPTEPAPAVAPTTETISPLGEGKLALELSPSRALIIEGTANLTALDHEFTIEAWIRWPEDPVPGMSLLGNRARRRVLSTARQGE